LEKKVWWAGVSELRELPQLKEENSNVKQIVADLSLNKQMLQEVIKKRL
jgi:putative transposase